MYNIVLINDFLIKRLCKKLIWAHNILKNLMITNPFAHKIMNTEIHFQIKPKLDG